MHAFQSHLDLSQRKHHLFNYFSNEVVHLPKWPFRSFWIDFTTYFLGVLQLSIHKPHNKGSFWASIHYTKSTTHNKWMQYDGFTWRGQLRSRTWCLCTYNHMSTLNNEGKKKLQQKYYGPYGLLGKVGKFTYALGILNKGTFHDVFHISY